MKGSSKWLDVAVESVNYVIIVWALSNMAMLLKSNPIFILLFASEVWTTGRYLKEMRELTESKTASVVLTALCFAVHIAILYFIGRVVEEFRPF